MFAVPSPRRAGNSYKCGADRIDGRENPHKVRRSMVARSRRHSLETTREGTRLPCVAVEDVSLQLPLPFPQPFATHAEVFLVFRMKNQDKARHPQRCNVFGEFLWARATIAILFHVHVSIWRLLH